MLGLVPGPINKSYARDKGYHSDFRLVDKFTRGLGFDVPRHGTDCEAYFHNNFHTLPSKTEPVYKFEHICKWQVFPGKERLIENDVSFLDKAYINSLQKELFHFLKEFETIIDRCEPPKYDTYEDHQVLFGSQGLKRFLLHLYWLCDYCQENQYGIYTVTN